MSRLYNILNKIIEDTGWITLNTNAKYRVKSGIVFVQINNANLTTSTTTFGTLPEEYRPTTEVAFLLRVGSTWASGWITAGGYVRAAAPTTVSNCSGSVAFLPQ